MSSNGRSHEVPLTPPPDDGYWAALFEAAEEAIGSEPKKRSFEPDESFPLNDFTTDTPDIPMIAGNKIDWQQVLQIFQSDKTVELPVIGYNRGGLLVEWGALSGFVPASQLINFPIEELPPDIRRESLAAYVGTNLQLRIIELERSQSRLILSERAAAVPPGTRHQIFDQLQHGDTCEGIVTNLVNFGAFVDLGGVEGLIHISELSWGRVRHPNDILQSGDQIKVYVLEINSDESRVALSLKRLQPDPWKTVEERYHVDQIIEGQVTHVVDFGAFVCVEEGLEGLIHISELAEGQFLHPYNVVKEGDQIKARILQIDGKARRLGLSLRH